MHWKNWVKNQTLNVVPNARLVPYPIGLVARGGAPNLVVKGSVPETGKNLYVSGSVPQVFWEAEVMLVVLENGILW